MPAINKVADLPLINFAVTRGFKIRPGVTLQNPIPLRDEVFRSYWDALPKKLGPEVKIRDLNNWGISLVTPNIDKQVATHLVSDFHSTGAMFDPEKFARAWENNTSDIREKIRFRPEDNLQDINLLKSILAGRLGDEENYLIFDETYFDDNYPKLLLLQTRFSNLARQLNLLRTKNRSSRHIFAATSIGACMTAVAVVHGFLVTLANPIVPPLLIGTIIAGTFIAPALFFSGLLKLVKTIRFLQKEQPELNRQFEQFAQQFKLSSDRLPPYLQAADSMAYRHLDEIVRIMEFTEDIRPLLEDEKNA